MKNLKKFESVNSPKSLGVKLKLLYREENNPHESDVYIGSRSLLSYFYMIGKYDNDLTKEQLYFLNELYKNIEKYIDESKKEKFRKEELNNFRKKLNHTYPNDPKPNFWHAA